MAERKELIEMLEDIHSNCRRLEHELAKASTYQRRQYPGTKIKVPNYMTLKQYIDAINKRWKRIDEILANQK